MCSAHAYVCSHAVFVFAPNLPTSERDIKRTKALPKADIEQTLNPRPLMLCDVSAHIFPTNSFDLVFSRFGVMFFTDPVATFGLIKIEGRSGKQANH